MRLRAVLIFALAAMAALGAGAAAGFPTWSHLAFLQSSGSLHLQRAPHAQGAATAKRKKPKSGRDRTPPTAPRNFRVTSATASSVAVAWRRSTDNRAVAGYSVYVNGALAGKTRRTSWTVLKLGCGMTVRIGVQAYDAARNRSRTSIFRAANQVCPPGAPALHFGALQHASESGNVVYFRQGGTGSFTLGASATDPESGIDHLTFPTLGGGWTGGGDDASAPYETTYSYDATAVAPGDPQNVTATNHAGLASPPASFTVVGDAAGPTTAASCNSSGCASTFYTTAPVSIALSATDVGSGVASIAYTTNGSDPRSGGTTYSAPFNLSATTTVKAVATDKVGNVGPVVTIPVQVDTTAPTTPALNITAGAASAVAGTTAFYRAGASGGFSIVASSTDAQSGIDHYVFPGLGSGWTNTGGAYAFTGGASDPAEPLNITAVNGAGLVSMPATFTVTPDASAPVSTASCGITACEGWSNQSVGVTLAASDGAGSGVKEIRYTTDGSTPTATTGTVYAGTAIPISSPTTLKFLAIDNVGNAEAVQTQSLQVDTTKPFMPTLGYSPGTASSVTADTVFFNTHVSGGFTVTPSSSDPESGIDHFNYPSLGSGWSSTTPGVFAFTSGAVAPVEPLNVTAVNGAGLVSDPATFTVTGDGVAPVTTAACNSGACSGWYSSAVSVTLAAGDGAGSGVKEIRYTTDGSAPTPAIGTVYSGPVVVGSTKTLKFIAIDAVGNAESVKSQLVQVDTTKPAAPTFAFGSFTKAVANSGTLFYNSNASGGYTVTPSSVDAESGIKQYNFPALGTGWSGSGGTYTFTAGASDPGEPNNVTAVNNAGLTSDPTSFTVTADGSTPTTTMSCNGGSCAGWFGTGGATVTLAATDGGGSGVATTKFTTDGSDPLTSGTAQLYSGGFAVSSTKTVRFASTDAVGNAETVRAVSVKIDTSAPTTTISCNGGSCSTGWYGAMVTVSLDATDGSGSGVQQIWYTTNGTDPTPLTGTSYTVPFQVTGSATVKYSATDAVGNSEPVKSRSIQIDTSPPSTTAAFAGASGSVFPDGSGTLWYRPGGSGAFDVTATVTDGESAPQKATFPNLAGFGAGGDDSTAPYSAHYSYSGTPTEPGAITVTGTNNAGLTSTANRSVSADSTAPTGGSVSYTDGYNTAGSIAVTTTNGSDSQSGLDLSSAVLERDSGTLADGTCGAFSGTWTTVSATPDSVAGGACYRYRYRIADRVGNVATYTSPNVTKVDVTAPTQPTLTFTGLAASVSRTGSTLYYRAGTSGGFTTTAAASDGESGLQSVSFPVFGSGWSGGGSDTTPPYATSYSYNGAPFEPGGGQLVTALNRAGVGAPSAPFAVVTDAVAPTTAVLCNGGPCGSGWFASAPVSISLNAADGGSGIDRTIYTLDGSTPTLFNGLMYGGPFTVGSGQTVRFRSYDRVGNQEAVASQDVHVDSSPPVTTLGTANVTGSIYANGTGKIYYRPGGSGSFDLTANVTDPESGPAKAHFPSLAGFGVGGDSTTAPYSSRYTYSGTPAEPGDVTVTGTNQTGLTSDATVGIKADSNAPSGGSISYTDGFDSDGSIPITQDEGVDFESGVDASATKLERQIATLAFGTCRRFADWTVASAPDTLPSGTCANYRLTVSDRVGNTTTYTSGNTVKVDLDPPTATMIDPGSPVHGVVTLSSNVTDDSSGVASTQYQYRATGAATWTNTPIAWDTTALPNGPYDLRVRATDNAGNVAASAPVTATVANLDFANAFKAVEVGPGYVDASVRQVIRTTDDRAYIFASDDTAQRTHSGPGVMRAWRATGTGIPTAFTEVDAAHRPSATGTDHVLCSPDVRLDRSGIAHLLYANETDATLVYQTFSTITDTWGPKEVIANDVNTPWFRSIKRGTTANALVLDSNDVPHVVYTSNDQVLYRNHIGGVWSTPVTISTGGSPIHPSLAFDSSGILHAAWLDDAAGAPTIKYARRIGTAWSAVETVASGDVLTNSNTDQGPSIVVTASGRPEVTYVTALPVSAIRVKYRTPAGWVFDSIGYDAYTHTPQIYSRGDDVYVFSGHDADINFSYLYHVSGQAWSPYLKLVDFAADGSASVRWDPARDNDPAVIDASFYNEDSAGDKSYVPKLYYIAALSDTDAPSVSVTGPSPSTTVSGTTTLTASASDDTRVKSVQFRVDGVNVGAPDATAPYSVPWDTTTSSNGVRSITAVARDFAGHATTSAAVAVDVQNAAPTVLLGTQTIASNLDYNAAGLAEAFQTTASASGTVHSLSVYLDATSGASKVVVGLYANASSAPGTLLAQATIDAPANGAWNPITLPATSVVAGTSYWIVILGPAGSGTVRFRDAGGGLGSPAQTSAQTTLTTLPGSWTTGSFIGADGPISAFGSS